MVSLTCLAHSQTAPAWRYDLLPGDHLIYRYTFHRQAQDNEVQFQTEARFRTQVLVTAISAGRISLGFQRNREMAELTEYRSKGKDKLAQEQVDFNRRLQKRPSRFSEAMEISPTGEPRYPWEVARETPSHLLDSFHEVIKYSPFLSFSSDGHPPVSSSVTQSMFNERLNFSPDRRITCVMQLNRNSHLC
jgi:hypothetical protein